MSVKTRASSAGGTYIFSGTLAARPAAGVVNRYYWATDLSILYRDNGVAWQQEFPHFMREIYSDSGRSFTGSSVHSNNREITYNPYQIPFIMTVDGIIMSHSNVGAGNQYVAVYDSLNYAPVNRLAVSVSIASAGIRQKQFFPFTTPVQLVPGIYFGVHESDNATDNYMLCSTADMTARIDPPNINNGLPFYYEDHPTAAYGIPPLVATPLFQGSAAGRTKAWWQALRISSIP
ncbi:hypothetical protein CH330_01320 [candidate division WOR-3 bacterium JGI_Cruoil_03_51_56]|uniref:Uncharacterized protein n=1 Tax=candidate division WOR-3 bacterium JGI_Cruoil_03_51_56 TaxID=1973747 RepID=A0A235BXK5_UNCW3|nr:MAG: hypothetical protein CH330_01320 [candidate division WOR-3 bacterium JGI_Cruoil_03_51_56]